MLCTMPVWGLMTFCVGEEIYIHSLPRNERVEYLQRKDSLSMGTSYELKN